MVAVRVPSRPPKPAPGDSKFPWTRYGDPLLYTTAVAISCQWLFLPYFAWLVLVCLLVFLRWRGRQPISVGAILRRAGQFRIAYIFCWCIPISISRVVTFLTHCPAVPLPLRLPLDYWFSHMNKIWLFGVWLSGAIGVVLLLLGLRRGVPRPNAGAS